MEMGITADGLGGLWVALHSLNFFRNFGRSLPTEIREVKFSDFGPKNWIVGALGVTSDAGTTIPLIMHYHKNFKSGGGITFAPWSKLNLTLTL